MAEAVLSVVLGKLAEVIANEAQLLGGVENKVERVKRELIQIKCCLQDADSKSKGDATVQNWLNDLRDVAYRIEDATDTFSLEVKDHHQKNPSGVQNSKGCSRFLQKLKELFKKPSEVPILHKLANELDAIQNLLEEINNRKQAYGIRDLPLEDKSKGEAVKMPFRSATYSKVDETQVVGMQADKNNILERLSSGPPRLVVITIVGTGGLGKTTLAHMVYTSAQAYFDYHIMLAVSQQFSLTDLLRKIISKDNEYVPTDRDVDYYAGELKTFLSTRRYLIILDDVWTGDLWIELKAVLPDNNNGSRVLITTRLIDVAKLADSKIAPYKLNLLNESESLDLLLKKAFPYQEPNEEYPKDLLKLAPELSKKCNGLPLALIVLGSILATKEPSYPAWQRVLQTMTWPSDGRSCMQILSMSYEDMPYYLKACFQYLSSFPENWEISAKCLIRMWIAEGFIPLEGKPTIQIMVEDCLEELAKRSMVQVLSRSINDLIKHFKVHDLLRELAMDEAKHENFVNVFSQASDETNPDRIIRRVSLQAQERNPRFVEYVGPKTRSLLLFGFDNCEMSLHCSNFRLLKVLEIVGTWKSKYELKSLGELIHLKYLGLRNCNIDLSSCSFRGMRSLETLDVRESVGTPPCDDIWSIGTLMHVLDDEFRNFFNRPLPIDNLSNLQTLKWVLAKRGCDAKLPNLRKLGITNIKFGEWVSITNLLQTMPVLVSLGIHADGDLPIEIVYPKALPNYQGLQSLYLHGKWPENVNVKASMLPPYLVKLTLRYTHLNHDPLLELGKLNSLKKLCLGCHAFTNDWESPINCQEQKGFPALQYVEMSDKNIKNLKWEIIERVCVAKFPNLRKLDIRNVSDEWVSTINLLQSLRFLVSLRINAEEKSLPPEIVYPKALPNYHNLQSLDLNGRWPENVKVEARLFPPHLLELSLKYTSLNHNPIPELGRLNNLNKLCLGSNALNWEGPIICREGFPALQHFEVTDEKIQDLTVVAGVMSKLTHLNVHSNIKMHLPPELHDVTVKKTSVNIVFID